MSALLHISHNKYLHFVTLYLLSTCGLSGQYQFKDYQVTEFGNTIEQPITGAHHFRQDSLNRMIIEGWHGAAVYDGNSFRVDDESPFLQRKLIDTDGDYWYGGPHGQLILKRTNGLIDSMSIKPYLNRLVVSILEDKDRYFIVSNDGILIAKKTSQGVDVQKTIRTDGDGTWSVKSVQDTLYLKGMHKNQYYVGPTYDKAITYHTSVEWRIDNDLLRLADGRILMKTSTGDTILNKNSYIHQYLMSIDPDNIHRAMLDSKGKAWLVFKNKLEKNGLYQLHEREKSKLEYYRLDPEDQTAPRELYEDHLGHLWVGTEGHGVKVICNQPIQVLDKRSGLSSNNIWGAYQLQNGDLEVLAGCDGINSLKQDNSITLSDHEGCAWTTLEDSKGQIWTTPALSTYKDGQLIKTYPVKFNSSDGLHRSSIWSLVEDSEGIIWAGTNQALHKIENENIIKYLLPGIDETVRVFDIIEYKPEHLILATSNGMLFTFYDGVFDTIPLEVSVSKILKDGDKIWISTFENGIYSWNGQTVTSYNHITGVPQFISLMQDDANGYLWGVRSDKSEIFAFDKNDLLNNKKSTRVYSYTMDHGVPLINTNSSYQHTSACLKDGRIFFANIHGGMVIDPDIIISSVPEFDIVLETDSLSVLEKSFSLPMGLNYTELFPIAMDLHPVLPAELAYKKGDDWLPVKKGTIKLNNIKAGENSISIKGRYANHDWQEPVTYILNRPPVLHERTWFRLLMGLLTIGFILLLVKWRTRHISQVNQKLESKIKEQVQVIENDKNKIEEALTEQRKLTTELKLATASKNRMYARIAHEFKSPLQSVKSILSKGKVGQEIPDERLRALNNIDNLLKTSNEIMEMSKAKDGKLRVEKNWYNILGIMRDQIELISNLAIDKDIKLNFNNSQEATYVNVDIFLISQVIGNLLSNAIKYSPRSSQVHISITKSEKQVAIAVQDQGYGIPTDEINLITTAYYRSESAIGEGTGIGLSLAEEILKLHDSSIQIKSTVGQGSEFSFSLDLPPLENKELINSLKSDDIIGTAIKDILNPDKRVILAVDDSEDILQFLVRSFKDDYYIVTAQNGQDGLYQLEQLIPDLIISDINMPFMDGISFLNEVRAMSKFRAVPFLFLTGSRTEEIEILGLKSGADQILQKPIKVDYLKSQVTQIISRKIALENNVRSAMADRILPNNIQSDDALLIENLEAIILEHISDPTIKSTDIANFLQMGEKTLRNRIKKITALTVKEYLRNFRLEKSKALLLSNQGTISEIANATGFRTASYFAKCFKEYFKMNPSEIRNAEERY